MAGHCPNSMPLVLNPVPSLPSAVAPRLTEDVLPRSISCPVLSRHTVTGRLFERLEYTVSSVLTVLPLAEENRTYSGPWETTLTQPLIATTWLVRTPGLLLLPMDTPFLIVNPVLTRKSRINPLQIAGKIIILTPFEALLSLAKYTVPFEWAPNSPPEWRTFTTVATLLLRHIGAAVLKFLVTWWVAAFFEEAS